MCICTHMHPPHIRAHTRIRVYFIFLFAVSFSLWKMKTNSKVLPSFLEEVLRAPLHVLMGSHPVASPSLGSLPMCLPKSPNSCTCLLQLFYIPSSFLPCQEPEGGNGILKFIPADLVALHSRDTPPGHLCDAEDSDD